ncbi:arginase family protein [Spirillospora sp. NPDC047279]|uniref:arginase family protein n=1 Tax=Spirillospora sp. NPDC047279 TaxID=3155478 RepID=UPI0034056C02
MRGLDVLTEIADGARRAVAERAGDLIVTVGGDCGVELAPVSAAAERYGDGLAVVWFDAHGDLNTPGSSPSHAFHGMILRTLLGDGPQALLPARPLRPDQVVLAGVRALDPAEQSYATATGLRRLSPRTLTAQPPNGATNAVVAAVGETGAEAVYIHVDLDVLDPGTFGSQSCPEPGGITPETLEAAVRALTARFELAGLGITEYRPLRERDQDTLRTLVPRLLHGLG